MTETTKPVVVNRVLGSGSKLRQQTADEVKEEAMLQEDARRKAREAASDG